MHFSEELCPSLYHIWVPKHLSEQNVHHAPQNGFIIWGSLPQRSRANSEICRDAGFLPDILKVLRALPSKHHGQWQGMCFSATLPPKIQQVLSNVLKKDHVSISTYVFSETCLPLRDRDSIARHISGAKDFFEHQRLVFRFEFPT